MRANTGYLFSLFVLVGLLLTSPASAAEGEGLEAGYVNPGHVEKPAWFKESFLDLREDVAEAAEEDKRVILYFYQDGCPYCERLVNTNFALQAIAEKTQANFDLIAINMWGDREVTDLAGEMVTEKAFAIARGVQFTPTLLFLNEQGGVAFRANGYYPPHRFEALLDYVAGHHEMEGDFVEYLAVRQPQAASGELHTETATLAQPYRLDVRSGERPLLVLFEQRDCAPCDELHGEALQREGIAASLDLFDVAVVDMWSRSELTTPQGEVLAARDWARSLGVQYAPGMVFFDAEGREVFRTEAYLRPFHLHAALDYVASGAYRAEPEFQRFVQQRADQLREQGIEPDLWR